MNSEKLIRKLMINQKINDLERINEELQNEIGQLTLREPLDEAEIRHLANLESQIEENKLEIQKLNEENKKIDLEP